MHTVGLENYFLAIWRGLFERIELHTWQFERTGAHRGGGRERRQTVARRSGRSSERRGLCDPAWPLGIFSTGHLFMPVSPTGLWASTSPKGIVTQSCPTLCDPTDCSLQAPPSMGFSRQEYWSRVPFPSPGDPPDPGIKPRFPTLYVDAFAIWARNYHWWNSGFKSYDLSCFSFLLNYFLQVFPRHSDWFQTKRVML